MPTTPIRLRFVLSRPQVLSLGETASIHDLEVRGRRRRWGRIGALRIQALEGPDEARAMVEAVLLEPDPERADLQRLAELLDELWSCVPGAEAQADDPLAVFGSRDGRMTLDGARLLPTLAPGWQAPSSYALTTATDSPPRPLTPPPANDAELADLLEILDRSGPDERVVQAGLQAAQRSPSMLREALFGGKLPGAACGLMGPLAAVGLVEREAIVEAGRALAGDGDARERRAAEALLRGLDAALDDERGDPAWTQVTALGRSFLAAPLGADDGGDDGAEDASDWLDDLDLDTSEGTPDEDPIEAAVEARLLQLQRAPLLAACARLAGSSTFASRALGRLGADDASAAGACLLLQSGRWPHGRLPGWSAALATLITSARRPAGLRALACHALAAGGTPAAASMLISYARGSDPALARPAVVALGRVPLASARLLVREAFDRPELVGSALRSMALAHDVLGFERAEALLGSPPESRSTALRALALRAAAACGGRRALPAVDATLESAADRVLRSEAIDALVALASPQRILSWSARAPAWELERALQATARFHRLDLLPLVHACSGHCGGQVRAQVARTLGALGLPATTPLLMNLLVDRSGAVGLEALDALATAGDARCVRLLRLLAGHPGPPGAAAAAVLERGELLRRTPPDHRIRIVARSTEPIPSRDRARITSSFAATAVPVHAHERGLDGSGELSPDDLAGLSSLVRALTQADEAVPTLLWSVRDPQGLIRRLGGRWVLSSTSGWIVRDAGWLRAELSAAARPPLSPLARRPQGDALSVDSLPIGVAGRAPSDLTSAERDGLEEVDESVEDEATEQTISDFLEEATGGSRRLADIPGTSTIDGLEEDLFETSPPPRRGR